MIDQLPPSPSTPAFPARPSTPRAQTTAPFEGWLSAPRQAADLTSNDGEEWAQQSAAPTPATAALDVVVAVPGFVEAVFEFHVRGATGAAEVVSVPWRLAGHEALSYLSRNPHTLTTAQLLQLQVSADAKATTAPASGLPPAAASARTSLSMDMTFQTPMVFASSTAARTASKAVAELAGTALPAAVAEPWLARLLRWFEQQGHDPVVWIRDYRLDDAASQAVVKEVRALASQQGWQLERIVVNSRELWSAAGAASLKEHLPCP